MLTKPFKLVVSGGKVVPGVMSEGLFWVRSDQYGWMSRDRVVEYLVGLNDHNHLDGPAKPYLKAIFDFVDRMYREHGYLPERVEGGDAVYSPGDKTEDTHTPTTWIINDGEEHVNAKINAIKATRDALSRLGLKDAKDLVEYAQSLVKDKLGGGRLGITVSPISQYEYYCGGIRNLDRDGLIEHIQSEHQSDEWVVRDLVRMAESLADRDEFNNYVTKVDGPTKYQIDVSIEHSDGRSLSTVVKDYSTYYGTNGLLRQLVDAGFTEATDIGGYHVKDLASMVVGERVDY